MQGTKMSRLLRKYTLLYLENTRNLLYLENTRNLTQNVAASGCSVCHDTPNGWCTTVFPAIGAYAQVDLLKGGVLYGAEVSHISILGVRNPPYVKKLFESMLLLLKTDARYWQV